MPTTMAALITESLHDGEFQRAVFTGNDTAGRRVVVRPVELRAGIRTQITWHTATTADTRNYPDVHTAVEALTAVEFRTAHIEFSSSTVEGRVTKKGRLLLSRRPESNVGSLAHDRQRPRPIPPDAAFLDVLGVSRDGVVKPTAQRKFRQINEFVRVLGSTVDGFRSGHLRVLDFGCGNAYLTFATVHHLRQAGIACTVTGIDQDADLIARNNVRARQLGWQDQLAFTAARIDGYLPAERPDLVIGLHACDTATDDLLAFAVGHGASHILASPCCHHDIQRQLRPAAMPAAFRDLARDGVLTEQLGDVITDALRASVLRMAGYTVDVFAFVPVEHTPRNNLIRAVRTGGHVDRSAAASVEALTAMFGVRPRLVELLRPHLPVEE